MSFIKYMQIEIFETTQITDALATNGMPHIPYYLLHARSDGI